MCSKYSLYLVILFSGAVTIVPLQATVIEVPSANGTLSALGVPNISTIGQTFRLETGDDRYLQSVTFGTWDSYGIHRRLDFSLYVYQWSGTNIIGEQLYKSKTLYANLSEGVVRTTVELNGVELRTGVDYVWFLSTTEYYLEPETVRYTEMPINVHNPYSNGGIVYFANEDNFQRLFDESWNLEYLDTDDIQFSIVLSPIPEPNIFLYFVLAFICHCPMQKYI